MLMFALYYVFSSNSLNFAILFNFKNFKFMKTNKYLIALLDL